MKYTMIMAILMLSACTAEKDMQGVDPNDYYAAHPIENKVESRHVTQLVHFMPASETLSDEDAAQLREALEGITPPAVDSITIRMSPYDKFELLREDGLAHALRKMGYKKIHFVTSKSVERGAALVDVAYLAVIPPDCPDWRMSPVTSYSNTWQGNTKCAEAVNLGLMIEDPHDLVHGTGDVPIDTERSSKAVQEYNSGKDFMPATVSAGSSSSNSNNSNGSSGGGSGASSGISGMNSSTSGGMSSMGGSQ